MDLNRYTWQNILNAIPDMVALLDEQHKIIWLNNTMLKLLGMSREDCIGKYCYSLVHGLNEPPDYCPHSKFLKDRQNHSVEVYLDKLEGDYLVTISPIENDGYAIGSIHIARDISQSKRQQKELLLSESKFFAAFMNNPIGMCISHIKDGEVLEVNNAWSKVTGYSREEAIGKKIGDLNLYVDSTERDRLISILNEHGSVNDFDLVFCTKQGNTIYGQMSVSAIEIDGIQCWVTSYVDKTDAVKMEKAIRWFQGKIILEARHSIIQSLQSGVYVK